MVFTDVASATAAIQTHPACAEFVTLPTRYIVYYPFPGKVPGGALVDRTGNDLGALNTLYSQMDAFWQKLNPA